MTAYYNEIEPGAVAWLRELIKRGLIADGIVDDRSIEDVCPDDLDGFTQCHFFAGIGAFSYALKQAGWSDDRPIWTGSCPCQPFSSAGKGGGFADERHLWPAFHHLIAQRRPDTVIGEQVSSKDALSWLDLVRADLEGAHYAVGAIDTCSASVGAPNIRQRLYWVADRALYRRQQQRAVPAGGGERGEAQELEQRSGCGSVRGVADAEVGGRTTGRGELRDQTGARSGRCDPERGGEHGIVANTPSTGPLPSPLPGIHSREESPGARDGELERCGSASIVGHTGNPGLPVCERPALERTRGRQERRAAEQSDGAPDQALGGVGDTGGAGLRGHSGTIHGAEATSSATGRDHGHIPDIAIASGLGGGLAHPDGKQGDKSGRHELQRGRTHDTEQARMGGIALSSSFPRIAPNDGLEHPDLHISGAGWPPSGQQPVHPIGGQGNFWGDCTWIPCRDGKWRPVKPGIFPLASGSAARVVRLRGYGNSLNAQVAIKVIESLMDVLDGRDVLDGLST